MLMLQAPNLSQVNDVTHGFFGRRGGVSGGVYASLNCGPGSGDVRQSVLENRARVLARLSNATGAHLLTTYQIHSAQAVIVDAPWQIGAAPQADAMATNMPFVALGILTADCAPVLFADHAAGVIGAAHAGWKGALAGVLNAAIEAMEGLGARRERICAAIGPAISQANYEVGAEFRARFLTSDPPTARFFIASQRPNHWQFDLEAYVAQRLAEEGVDDVVRLSACTYAREDDFFSFRRSTHRSEADYGRDISAIMLQR